MSQLDRVLFLGYEFLLSTETVVKKLALLVELRALFSAQQMYAHHTVCYEQCEKALVELRCKDLQPIGIAECPH